ncbi:hypothetical protein ACJ72_02628 [Emergomyces africanus]|uniref:Uncharacterized protein n=1 Tax=Emergomyces africanus TaxID=1955775 RepID=A0A1B7P2E7_9EURO|nr:hypothetical protein ACJ72_02628 [Emergomyces africanus]
MAPAMKINRTSSRRTNVDLPPRKPPNPGNAPFSNKFIGLQLPSGPVLEEIVPDQHNKDCSRIRKFTVVPGSPIMRLISQLPGLRRILWRRKPHTHDYNVRPIGSSQQRDATLIQTRGQTARSGEDMCGRCKRGYGPFTTCVVAVTTEGEHPKLGACANCVWRGMSRECSVSQTVKTHTDGSEAEQERESASESEDENEDEPFLLSPPPSSPSSQNSRGTATSRRNNASKASSQTVSTSSRPIRKSKRAQPVPSMTPRGRRPPSPAVVIPSPSKWTRVSGTGAAILTRRKYFKIPPGLSPNTADDIRLAIEELNAVRTKLYSRLELLESVQMIHWE